MARLITSLRGLPASVWLLGVISLLNDAASEMVYPLLPLFLASTLAAGPRVLGLIEGLAEAVSSLLKLVSGIWSDRTRRAKPFVVWGYGVAGLARTLIAAASGWWFVLACRLADRVGKGLRSSPRDAPKTETVRATTRFNWHLREFPPRFRRYLVILGLFMLGNSSNLFLILRARELGVPQVQVPLLWATMSLVAAVFLTPLSALSDRIGRRRVIVAGWIAYAAIYLVLGWSALPTWGVWAMFVAYGLFIAATEGAEKALVADLVPHGQLGTAFGWYHLTLGITLLPASLVFGVFWESVAPQLAFAFGAGCALLAAALMIFWLPPAR